MEYRPMAEIPKEVSPMVRAYLECAEWCGVDDEQREALELAVRPKWSPEAITQAREDCSGFMRRLEGKDLEGAPLNDSQLGHDFWLTRNRHGAGFWDRGLGKLGEILTDLSCEWGESWVMFDENTETLDLY